MRDPTQRAVGMSGGSLYSAWYSDCMSRKPHASSEDELLDAVLEDERANIAAELNEHEFIDDEQAWLSLP